MNRVLVVTLATSVLAGCASAPPPPPAPPSLVAEAAPPAPEPAPSPKPQYGTFGFDTAGMDTSVAPGDDFYSYANGTWAKSTPIPPDKSNYGVGNVLGDLSHERTREIIEEQAKDPSSRIGAA